MIQAPLAPQHGNRIRHGRGPESLLKRYFQFDTDDFSVTQLAAANR